MDVETKKKVRGRPFPKGKSGNPSGRPKVPAEVREAIRAACPDAVQVLIGIMLDSGEKAGDRIDAAKTLLDRGYGKPLQESAVQMDVTGLLDMRAQIRKELLILVHHGDTEG